MSKTGRGATAPVLYSPECVEGKFCELRFYGVLKSSSSPGRRICVNLSEKERDSVRRERDPVRQSGPRCRIILPDVGSVRRSSAGRHYVRRIRETLTLGGGTGVGHGSSGGA